MPEIFHIAERPHWQAAQEAGTPYTMSTRDRTLAEEGFIHCSATLDQVNATLTRFYPDTPNLVLLVIDPTKLDAPLRYEEADGSLFPHIYGPIPPTAVIEVRPLPNTR